MIRVAVIGGGAAGLCVARYLVSQPELFSPVVFEQTGSIGGLWVYTEKTGKDSNGIPIHCRMYHGLRINFFKEPMAFPDFPFSAELESFPGHSDVLKYLESYASHFGVDKVVQLNTMVTRVNPVKEAGQVTWEVTVKKLDKNKSDTNQFDAVIVCNGHFSTPDFPEIPGLSSFTGLVMHSQDYRRPEIFQDLDVVVLGGGLSGIDISVHLAYNANKVYLSHRNPRLKNSKLPLNIEQFPPILKITDDGLVQFTDGRTQRADAILLCTGYKFSFPFLSPECHVTVDLGGKRINPLYKDVFHTEHPSLAFVGINEYFLPFRIFSVQAQCIMAVLIGKAILPSREEMETDIVHEREKREALGWPDEKAHKLGHLKRSYSASLAKLAGCQSIDPVYDDLHDHATAIIHEDALHFRNQEITIKDSNTYFVNKK